MTTPPIICKDCQKAIKGPQRTGRCGWCYKKDRGLTTKHFEQCKVRNKRYRSKNPGMAARIHLLKRYGLTLDQFEKIKTRQNNKCKICLKGFSHTPYVDHDHVTNKVRGLLCRGCNAGIGHLLENEFVMSRAVAYLRHNGAIKTDWLETSFVELR